MTFFSQFSRKVIFLSAAICLVVTFTMGLHHHNDNCAHFDCPVCITANILSSGALEEGVSLFFCLAAVFILQPKATFHRHFSIFFIFSNRAPPAALFV